MTILYMTEDDDIFATECESIVIATNCLGTNGKGLAEEAARRFKGWDARHRADCRAMKPSPGSTILQGRGPTQLWSVRYVIALSTKNHWLDPSRNEWVDKGLAHLDGCVDLAKIKSVAIPALGCGTRTGQLSWSDVRPLVIASAERLSARGVRVELYPPQPMRDAAPRGRR